MSKHVIKHLECSLDAHEVSQRAQRAAHLLAERDEREARMKAEAKQAKSEIEALEAELRELSGQVRTRKEMRDVECQMVRELETRAMVTYRIDTGEEVERRPLTETELQENFPFDQLN